MVSRWTGVGSIAGGGNGLDQRVRQSRRRSQLTIRSVRRRHYGFVVAMTRTSRTVSGLATGSINRM
jgi:hypothetical protein